MTMPDALMKQTPLQGIISSRLRGLLGLVVVLIAWQISVWIIDLPDYFYPAPSAVFAAFEELVRKGILPAYIADSMGRYTAGVALGLAGLDEAEIMLGVLIEILGPHPVARQHRIARQLNVFVKNLGSIAADFDFRTIALIAAIGRIARLPPTAALALIIARPCFPAIHI